MTTRIVEGGLKVWVGRPLKEEPILTCEEIKRVYDNTVSVEATVRCSVKGMTYFISWQQTEDYGFQEATCTINTTVPEGRMIERSRVMMEPGQTSAVYSYGRRERLALHSWHTQDELLKKNDNIVGSVQLQVDFREHKMETSGVNPPQSRPSRIIFVFVFRYIANGTYDLRLLKRPSGSDSQDTSNSPGGAKRACGNLASAKQGPLQPNLRRSTLKQRRVDSTQEKSKVSTRSSQRDAKGKSMEQVARPRQKRAPPPLVEISDSDDDPEASIAEEQRQVDQAAIELKQAQRERKQAMLERRKLMQEQTQALKRGTAKMVDENYRLKATFSG